MESSSSTAAELAPTWWGTFELPVGTWAHWQVGPQSLWVQRQPKEWRIATRQGSDPLAHDWDVKIPSEPAPLDPDVRVSRFGTHDRSSRLRIFPRTADRAIVTRPHEPFFLPGGDEVTIYVTAPLWCRLSVSTASDRLLVEIPMFRPSDTWMGPPTEEGELAYASRTVCFMSLDELPVRPHRSLTAIHIRNRSDAPLQLERISLPVPRLSLFRNRNGQLWTQDVLLNRRGATDFADLRLGVGPPRHPGWTQLVAGPRGLGSSSIVRAFGSWLG